MFGLSTGELLLILLVLVVLFGAKKIPQLGETLGKGIRGLRKGLEAPVIDVTPRGGAAASGAPSAKCTPTEEDASRRSARSS